MMLLTRANPEQAAKLRALIRGDKLAGKPKAPKRTGKPRPTAALVETLAWLDGVTNTYVVQVPLYLDRGQYNANGAHWMKAKTAKQHIETTLLVLRSQLRGLSTDRFARERIRGITLVRLSPGSLGDDNLIAAFKHVRDAVCAWLKCGDDDFDRRNIGRFDDDVNTPGGLTCTYEQTQCARDKKAHGIQIRFHL